MENNPASAATVGVLKGCLGGIVLAVVFLGISGLMYLITSALHAPRSIILLVSIASGPILGTALLIGYALRLTSRMHSSTPTQASTDETTVRDGT